MTSLVHLSVQPKRFFYVCILSSLRRRSFVALGFKHWRQIAFVFLTRIPHQVFVSLKLSTALCILFENVWMAYAGEIFVATVVIMKTDIAKTTFEMIFMSCL